MTTPPPYDDALLADVEADDFGAIKEDRECGREPGIAEADKAGFDRVAANTIDKFRGPSGIRGHPEAYWLRAAA